MNEELAPHYIVWDNSLDIGIKSLDQQHQQLTVLMNELYDATENGGFSRSRLMLIISELVDFTVYHLDFEADCLFRYEYQDVHLHLEEHELFKERIGWFKSKVNTSGNFNDLLPYIKIMWNFLYTWLLEHINSSDRKFAGLLKANGMK